MKANLQLAAQILNNNFHNSPGAIARDIAPDSRHDADHEALAAAIALIIQHLDDDVDQLELPVQPALVTKSHG